MREFSGYLSLASKLPQHAFPNAHRFNSARAALAFYCLQTGTKTVVLPVYMCPSVPGFLEQNGVSTRSYNLERNLSVPLDIKVEENEVLLAVNYFGLMGSEVEQVCKRTPNVVIDETQALFHETEYPSLYSPRKFLPLPDGGVLTNADVSLETLEYSVSEPGLYPHALSADMTTHHAYSYYLKNEERMEWEGVMRMSKSTSALFNMMPLSEIQRMRNSNFRTLHSLLGDKNEIGSALFDRVEGPMVYPFLVRNAKLRRNLIARKVYVPWWWKNVLDVASEGTIEWELAKYLVPLPVDQRYDEADMHVLAEIVNQAMKES